MGLTPEQIEALLSKPESRPRRKTTGVDTSERTYQTWFKLHHSMIDDVTEELCHCQNPNCQDPRDHSEHSQMCVKINEQYMCRFCFMSGWLLNAGDVPLPLAKSGE